MQNFGLIQQQKSLQVTIFTLLVVCYNLLPTLILCITSFLTVIVGFIIINIIFTDNQMCKIFKRCIGCFKHRCVITRKHFKHIKNNKNNTNLRHCGNYHCNTTTMTNSWHKMGVMMSGKQFFFSDFYSIHQCWNFESSKLIRI